MAPTKFQPPLRKTNGSSSESSCSFSSFIKDVNSGKVPSDISREHIKTPSNLTASQDNNNSSLVSTSSKPRAETIADGANAQGNVSTGVAGTAIKKTEDPDKKKSKGALASTSKSKFQTVKKNDETKENVPPQNAEKISKKEMAQKRKSAGSSGMSTSNPKRLKGDNPSSNNNKEGIPTTSEKQSLSTTKKRPKDAPKLSIRSLTDSEYDCIFKAVLFEADSESSSKPLDVSHDLFDEFSQSDLDDSEEEQAESQSAKQLKNDICLEGSHLTKNNEPLSGACGHARETNNTDKECVPAVANKEQSTSEGVHIDANIATPTKQSDVSTNGPISSPSILYLCNKSQPGLDENSIHNDSQFEGDSLSQKIEVPQQEEDISCQGSSFDLVVKSRGTTDSDSIVLPGKAFITSTPISVKQTVKTTISNPLVTPQKASSYGRVPTLSQELTASPIESISQSCKTPAQTPSKSSSLIPLSQGSEGFKASASTLKRLPSTTLSSQTPGPSTPRADKNQSQDVVLTPRNSQQLSQDVQCTPRGSQQLSQDVQCTPRGSQHLSQDVLHTPPPQGLTAKDRLLWLQRKRLAGLWVQCDNDECGKWRYLADTHDPTTLPNKWYCSMHPDAEQNSCNAPTKRLSLHAEEDMIFNKYAPGSLVWAKLPGFPSWPAMVDDDPDLEQFYWTDLFSDIPTWYHVVFFDDKEPVTRAWIQVERLKAFNDKKLDDPNDEVTGFKKRISAAYKKAQHAISLDMAERLAQYGFASSYKGPIGGGPCASKRKYKGPLGYRELETKQ